jgi:hypothetical protein
MKKLTTILCALCLLGVAWWAQARTVMVVSGGGVAAAPACAAGTVNAYADTSALSGDGNSNITNDLIYAIGQSFQVSSEGTVYSILIYIGYSTGTNNVTMRLGTSTNLSDGNYLVEKTISVTSTGWKEFVFDTHPSIAASTTYYFGVTASGTDEYWARHDTSGDYTHGISLYGYGTTWLINNDGGKQMLFQVKLCN